MKTRFFFALLIMICSAELAAQWTDMNLSLTAGWGSEIQAVDYDLDGDLDLFICGSTDPTGIGYAKLYRNNGSWSFTLVTTGITGVYRGYSSWADFNNDGFMDVVITGRNNEDSLPIAKLYRGTAEHSFVQVTTPWTGLYYSWIDVGDYNNDGKIDILMTGINDQTDYVKLYRNEGNLAFTEVYAGIQNMSAGQCHFVDYDNDGDLDISVMGSGACILYRNDGTDTFTDIEAPFEPLRLSSSAWGDFDNDGLPDLITSGEGTSIQTHFYSNHGDGTFSQIVSPIPGVIAGSLYWGDYDNDGLLDILVTGAFWHYGPKISRIYKNNGDRTFTQQTTPFIAVSSSRAMWADFNNDGKLDVALAGYTGSDYVARVYRNNTAVTNDLPTAPTVVFDQNSSTISFVGATDTTNPVPGLTYNLRIGTSPGSDDVFSVLEESTGFRRNVKAGRTKFYFEPQPLQAYYASAQAIDNTFAGSAFGPELSFGLVGIPMIVLTGSDSLDFGSVAIGPNSSVQTVQIMNTGTATLRLNGTSFINPDIGFGVVTSGFPYQIAPGEVFNFQLSFNPQTVGLCETTLNIFSNAINSAQLAVHLQGTGITNPNPAAVNQINMIITGSSAQLSWSPVTTDVGGNPLQIDRYIVLFSEITDDNSFWYLGNTTDTSFTHNDVGLCADSMFYRVKAFKFDRRTDAERLNRLALDGKKHSWQDVLNYLAKTEEGK